MIFAQAAGRTQLSASENISSATVNYRTALSRC